MDHGSCDRCNFERRNEVNLSKLNRSARFGGSLQFGFCANEQWA
jgi:hypothetical protein